MRTLEILMRPTKVNIINHLNFYGDSQVFIQWMARKVVGRNTYLNKLLKEENCLKGNFNNISLLETMESIYYSDPTAMHTTSYRTNHSLRCHPFASNPYYLLNITEHVHHQNPPLEILVLEKVQGMRY